MGETADLERLRDGLEAVAERGESLEEVLRVGEGVGRLYAFRSDRGLQIVPLTSGLLVCGDGNAIRDVVTGLETCIADARSGRRTEGFHAHIELHDWYGTSDHRIGELTVYASNQ